MAKHGKKKDNKNGVKKKDKNNGRTKKPRGCAEIVFDPDARSAYLKGFSERKRQRRVFGLAMQKVKDRKARLEERAEVRAAMKEQVEEAEKQKEELMEAYTAAAESESLGQNFTEASATTAKASTLPEDNVLDRVETYQDVQTQSQWGGQVIVTTSTHIPGDEDDEEEEKKMATAKKKDVEQEYAGNVEKFMNKLKGNMPGKKKGTHSFRKGKHGAAGMKGMAGAADLKVAQKFLKRSTHTKGSSRKKR